MVDCCWRSHRRHDIRAAASNQPVPGDQNNDTHRQERNATMHGESVSSESLQQLKDFACVFDAEVRFLEVGQEEKKIVH